MNITTPHDGSMRHILALLLLTLLPACGPVSSLADAGIFDACSRSFHPTLEAWETKFGRVPEQCSTLDTVYAVQLVAESEIPPTVCKPEPGLVGCFSPGEKTIYLLRGRDPADLVDSSVHEWIHALAQCVYDDNDASHTIAGLWSDYGPGSVEIQADALALIGACQADLESTVDSALGFVPDEYRPLVKSLMVVLYALAAFLALLRPFLNRWIPANSRFRWIVEKLDKALHYAAANSKPLDARVAPQALMDEVTPLAKKKPGA